MRVYRMAERNIGIESLYVRVHVLCAAYETDGEPDFVVRITPADIAAERENAAREDRSKGQPAQSWKEEYLEELAVYRQIAERILAYDTFLLHGSVVSVDGKGYLFAARSGVGKSTHAQLWQALLGDRMTYVNDDKPLVRITAEAALVYGTPYDGKHHRSTNTVVPLEAICLLQRGEQNAIRRISAREAFPRLMQQVYCPQDRAAMTQTMALVQALTKRVKFYELACNMDPDAARVAFEGMGGTLP